MIPADPYPWPYDGEVVPHRLAIVVAGAQAAWADRSIRAGEVGAVVRAVCGAARTAGAAVVHLRHAAPAPRPSGLPPAPGAPGWDLVSPPEPGDLVVDAGGVDGFCASPLDGLLRSRGITHLVMVGWGAEAAVDSTLRSANDRGYECLVLTDAVAPFDSELGAHALSSVTMSGGIFGALGTSADLLPTLAPTSATLTPLTVPEAP
jgi:biuret amidohydrolase